MSNWIYFESNLRNVIAGTDPMATYAIEDMVKNTAFTVFTENKDEILDEVNDKMRDRVRDQLPELVSEGVDDYFRYSFDASDLISEDMVKEAVESAVQDEMDRTMEDVMVDALDRYFNNSKEGWSMLKKVLAETLREDPSAIVQYLKEVQGE
jgi:hypothetical protein